MLSKIILFTCLVAVGISAVAPEQVPIVSSESDLRPDGSYEWSYQSGDNSAQQQSGELKQLGHDAGEVSQGSYSWVDPEGGQHQISYVADDKGYQPQGADLPVAPPIPLAISRAIDWIAAHPQAEQKKI